MKITLKGNPISTGSIYKSRCMGRFPCIYITPAGKALKKSYVEQAKKQYRANPLELPLMITVSLYFGTKRKYDWDNFHKLSMDSLTGIVWVDDSQIQKALVTKNYDKKNPRIEIEITNL